MPGRPRGDSLVDEPVGRLLDAIASEATAPGSAAVAALTVGSAAGLVAMAARRARGSWPEASAAAAQADALRERARHLVGAGARAYAETVDALEGSRETDVGRALLRAADIPLVIVQIAADVAALGLDVARSGASGTRGEAAAGALLAAGAGAAAAHLVRVNLALREDDVRVQTVTTLSELTRKAAAEAAAADV